MEAVYKEVGVHFGVGLAIGAALEKSRVLDPSVIRGQLAFATFTVGKVWLTAVAASLVALVVASYVSPEKWSKARKSARGAKRDRVGRAWWTLAGCFAGAFLHSFFEPQLRQAWAPARRDRGRADLLFSANASNIDGRRSAQSPTSNSYYFGQGSGAARFFGTPASSPTAFRRAAWCAFTCLVFVAVCLEAASPWQAEAVRSLKHSYAPFFSNGAFARLGSHYGLRAHAWSPSLVGCVIGVAQFPLVLFAGSHTLAVSEVYVTLLAPALDKADTGLSVDVAKRANLGSDANAARIALFLALPLGAYLSSARSGLRSDFFPPRTTRFSDDRYASLNDEFASQSRDSDVRRLLYDDERDHPLGPTVSYLSAFFGGLLAVAGSRLAYAGPLAHAVSGVACASVPALTAAPSLAAGAFAARLLLYAFLGQ